MNIDLTGLQEDERKALEDLLAKQNPHIQDDLEQIWYLLDLVWDELGCDNKTLNWDKIATFYAHPVWALNGLFIESHALSLSIRKAIAHYIAAQGFKKICDYGGGFGSLAKEIAKLCPEAQIDIYEPFPSEYGKQCIEHYSNITFVSSLKAEHYDCLLSTDVLEHVDSVLDTFESMLSALKVGGYALIGNCFYPVIKCHLPKHFHYRYSFKYIAQMMGVRYKGVIEGAEYVQIYSKYKNARVNLGLQLAGGGEQMYICGSMLPKTSNQTSIQSA